MANHNKRRAKLFGTFYRWHTRLGLFLAAHLVLLLSTGTILVFKDELQQAMASPKADGLSEKRFSLQELLDQALAKYPKDRPVAVQFDEDHSERVTFRLGLEGSPNLTGARRVLFDTRFGAITATKETARFWTFILEIHREFLLGFYGKVYVGIIGFLLVLSLLSGLYLYGPTTSRSGFGWIRRGKTSWTLADIHKAIGVTSLGWLLLLGSSGFFLGLSGQLLKLYQFTELRDLSARYGQGLAVAHPVSLDAAEQAVKSQRPEGNITFITFPNTEFSTPQHYIFVVNGTASWDRYLSELILVDAATGAVAEVRTLPWYLKAALISEPLHFGNYGGWPLKTVWVTFGLLGLALTVTGPLLYFAKQRQEAFKKIDRDPNPRVNPKRSPYRVPVILLMVSIAAVIAAMFLDGWIDGAASVLLTIPIVILGRKLLSAFSIKKPQ